MERVRERGGERERVAVKSRRDHPNWRWEIRGKSSYLRSARDPKEHSRGNPLRGDHTTSSRRPTDGPRQWSGRVALNGFNDGAWGTEEAGKRQGGVSRGFSRDKIGKKSFRDLFSQKDIEEGGKWTEVRRRRVPPRDRSPIIKRLCFACGVGGHIRRNCPRKLKMRCYGCNSASHLIRNCTAIMRPEETAVELKSVSDITDRVQHLFKYAIFRARGLVNIHSLKTAMTEKFREAQWQDRVFPIDRNSFLVGFPQEHWRDWAVLSGRMDFGEFSGTFYAWDENWGALQVLWPVIVWITLRGLPLHLWGKEEIKAMLAPFGKLHKLDDNFYKKERADYVKVMVEVEDISLVPKTVKCSYKALTDERVRIYSVTLIPSSTCLPVSQWNDETYKSYAEDGGSGGYVEQNWSRREEVPRRAPRRQAEMGGDGEEGEADSAHAQRHVPPNQARNAGAGEGRQAMNAGGNAVADFRDPVDAMADLLEEERERRRKGKGIQIDEGNGPRDQQDPSRPIIISSGSGSCDPNGMGAHVSPQPAGSDEADSKAGPTRVQAHDGMSQDYDLGGEGEMRKGEKMEDDGEAAAEVNAGDHRGLVQDRVVEEMVDVDATAGKEGRDAREAVEAMGLTSANQDVGGVGRRRREAMGGRSSSNSVPPGFRKIQKPRNMAGVSLPFGKMQRGGFKFLKRSASSGSSGQKHMQSQPKKNRPIASISGQEIEEVAANVGVVGKLSQDQISSFKELERKRASE